MKKQLKQLSRLNTYILYMQNLLHAEKKIYELIAIKSNILMLRIFKNDIKKQLKYGME